MISGQRRSELSALTTRLSIVVHDVTVVQRDNIAIPQRQQIPIGKPARTPLPVLARRQTPFFERGKQSLNPRAVNPKNRNRRVEILKKASRRRYWSFVARQPSPSSSRMLSFQPLGPAGAVRARGTRL